MDKWFVMLLGAVVACLYIPPIAVPARHRDLARKILAKPHVLRRFGFAMVVIGIVAILLSNNSDLHHRVLFVGGIIETLAGAILLTRPEILVLPTQSLISGPLWAWVIRGVAKFALGITICVWGIRCF